MEIYCDFEAILEEEEEEEQVEKNTSSENNFLPRKTTATRNHYPCSHAYIIVAEKPICNDPYLSEIRLHRGLNTAEKFIQNIRSDVNYLYQNYLLKNTPMVISNHEEELFQATTNCYVCNRKFQNIDCFGDEISKLTKTRDHCHITGKYFFFKITRDVITARLFFSLQEVTAAHAVIDAI